MDTAADLLGSVGSPSTVVFFSMKEQTDFRSLVTEAFKATDGKPGFPEGRRTWNWTQARTGMRS